MTSVMPAWKQALIEKKRKKEQEEKAKIPVQNDNSASLPEWKKTLLAKKKGVQSQDADYGLDNPNIKNNNSTVSGYDRLGEKTNSFTTTSTEHEHEHESNFGESAPKVIIIPKGNSPNAIKGGVKQQHSFVASSRVSQSDRQKEDKQVDQKLSNNGQEYLKNQGNVPKTDEANSRVSYEHIKTHSELRKLFGLESRDSSNKSQNQQTQSHKDVSTKPHRSSTTRDYEQSQTFASNIYPQYSSREFLSKDMDINMASVNHDNDSPKSHTPADNEDNCIVIVSEEDNDTGLDARLEDGNRLNGIKDKEIPAEVHVDTIRTKFGPSGNFRLHKSSSSDNLLKSKHQPMSPRSKNKPNIGGILSPTKSISDDEDILDSYNINNMKRIRSISMGDIRIDHNFHDFEPVVNLRHRVSVSTGIERRLQVLRHNLSGADGKYDDDYDDEENNCLDQDFKDRFPDNLKSSTVRSSGKQIDEDVPKIRKASWYDPEDEARETSLLDSHKRYDSNEKLLPLVEPTVKSFNSSSDSNNSSIKHEIHDKQTTKPIGSGRNVVLIDYEGKQAHNNKELSNKQELYASVKPVAYKTVVLNDKDSHETVYDDSDKDEKPSKGAVHKLSALFGANIPKGSKKDKPKMVDKAMKLKTTKEQQVNQENLSKKEKKDPKKSSSSRMFPWSKKPKMSEPMKEGEHTFTFVGAGSLRPVQQEVVEQKITGNMTLVINKNAGSYVPRSKQLNATGQVPGINNVNSLTGRTSQISSSRSKHRDQTPSALHKPDDMMVTVIDVPGTTSTNDVQVSAIDLPGPPSPSYTPVSVIDIPESPDREVSVIDKPDDEADSDDSDSSGSGMSGSYDINPSNASSAFVATTIFECTEEEEEEDIDNVPVSYFGDSTYMKVPEVIFESKVQGVKSCLKSSPVHSRKRKVVFNPSIEDVHDYPSEVCIQHHYDQYLKENGGNTIDQYRPSFLQGVERQNTEANSMENKSSLANKHKVFKSTNEKDAPGITYLDQGEGFSSSNSSGALLF